MELEDLKSAWASIDERLKKQEILKESIIKEMIYKKANKSLKVLTWSELTSIPVFLALIPFIVWAYRKFSGTHLSWDIFILFMLLFCIAFLPFLIYKAYLLMKVDLTKNFKDNLLYVNRFNVAINREKLGMRFGGPIIGIFMIIVYIELKVDIFVWVLPGCMFIFLTLFSYWSYKKIYDKNIRSIQKNLEELEELEE